MNAERFGVDPLDESIYDAVHDYKDLVTGKRGVVALSKATGLSTSMLQNYSNPAEPSQFTVKQFRTLILTTGDKRPLHQLAHDVGEACFPLSANEFPANTDLISAWADWQGEIAETMQHAKSILDDKKVLKAEVNKLRKELIEDFERGLQLLNVFEGMQEVEQ